MVDALKEAVTLKCENTKELMQKSKTSQRSIMRQLRVLAQDIIEMAAEKLEVNDAKKILYELLQDLGWEEGQSIAQDMTMSLFDQSTILKENNTLNFTQDVSRPKPTDADRLLRADFFGQMGVESGTSLLSEDEKKVLEEIKQELKNTDIDSSLTSFAN